MSHPPAHNQAYEDSLAATPAPEELDKIFTKYTVSLYQELMSSKTGAMTITKMKREILAYVDKRERQPITVNRLEVIDHTSNFGGRAYTKREKFNFTVELSQQDGGRTLKLFLDEALTNSKVTEGE